jgi:MFS family permease
MRGSMATCGTICDVSLESRDRATGRALCESIGSIPSLFAPFVAAFLITIFGGISVNSIRPLYMVQFVGFCGMFLLAVTQLAEVKRKTRKGKSTFLGDFREVFDRGIATKRFLLLFGLWNFIISMATPFKIPFAHQIKGVEQFIIGAMATSKILVPVLFATPIGKLSDRIGRKKIFYFLIPLLCASNLALVLASTSEGLIISALLSGFEGIVSMTVLFSMLPELVPEDCIGRWRGLIYMFRGLASIPAPIIGGFIWESVGPSFIFLITIGVYLLLIPLISTIPETLKM